MLQAKKRGYSEALTKELINLYNGTGNFLAENVRMLQEANDGRTLMYMIRGFKLQHADAFDLELLQERYESGT